jgi:hypothetical protein
VAASAATNKLSAEWASAPKESFVFAGQESLIGYENVQTNFARGIKGMIGKGGIH